MQHDLGVTMSKKAIAHFSAPSCYEGMLTDLWVSEGEIDSRMQRLASDVVQFYGSQDFTILVVLKGSVFVNDLLQRHLRQIYSLQSTYRPMVVTEYIKVKSYSNTQSTNHVQIEHIS